MNHVLYGKCEAQPHSRDASVVGRKMELIRRVYSAACLTFAATIGVAVPAMVVAKATATTTLDQDMPHLLADNGIASVSFAVIHAGRIVHLAAYGLQSAGTPATTDTVYNIASLTKPLTAEVILRLASKGRLSLDEPMDRYWSDPDLAQDGRRLLLTPRLALSHRAGFPNWRDTRTGLVFNRDPGGAWGYSGEGYQYVARFVEHKLGKPFEQLAQETLFEPTGMKTTSYTSRVSYEGYIAIPTDANGKALIPERPAHYNAADLVYTTPRDYSAFMVDVVHDRGLTSAIAKERDRNQVSMMDVTCTGAKAKSCPSSVGFGLGWQLLDFAGESVMMHTGKDSGVFTFAYLNRATRDGVVIFTNSDNGYKIVLPLLDRLGTSPAYLRYLRGQID